MSTTRWIRERAGVYRTEDSAYWLLRTDAWQGPKGGAQVRWELAVPSPHGGLDITGDIFERRLLDAKTEFDQYLERQST